MGSDARLLQLLYEVVDEINQGRAPEVTLGKSPHTVLMGSSGKLDSLGIVNLIVTVEDKVQQTFGRRLNLFDLMFSGNKAEWTIADLAEQLTVQ
jgi:acyl carrier protein